MEGNWKQTSAYARLKVNKWRWKYILVTGTALGLATYALKTHTDINKGRYALRSKTEKKEKQNQGSTKGKAKRKTNGKINLLVMLLKGSTQQVAMLAAVAMVRTALMNRLSYLQGKLFRNSFLKQKLNFAIVLGENFLACLAVSWIESLLQNGVKRVELSWRDRLTSALHTGYFKDMSYYKITNVDKRIDSAEQRICEDVPKYCAGTATLTGDMVKAVVDGVFYSYRLGKYTRTNRYTLAMLMYIVGAGVVVKSVSPNFGRLFKTKQKLEGDYRDSQARLRSNSESVAFYRGGIEVEARTISGRFKRMCQHNAKLLMTTWKFSMMQDFVLKYFGATFAVILIIGPFFEGHLRPRNHSTSRAEMLSNMRYHTGVVIGLFTALGTLGVIPSRLSKLKAYGQRITELKSVMEDLSTPDQVKAGDKDSSVEWTPETTCVTFEHATVRTPAGHVLIKDLNLVIEEGTNLLVTGPNGSGKSSLFRVLGDLWPLEEGHVIKPTSVGSGLASDIFYVPQKPYVSVGSLIEQLIYPSTLEDDRQLVDNPEMLTDLLAKVDLEYLVTDSSRYGKSTFDPVGDIMNWSDMLSLGEQQRLGMARLFYHKPRYAILDECTSGVTNDMEQRFCDIVEEMGCTCITISHRPALVAFHDKVLHLNGDGGWTLSDLLHDDVPEAQHIETSGPGNARRADSAKCFEGMINSASKKHGSKKKHDAHSESEMSMQHLGRLLGESKVSGGSRNSLVELSSNSLDSFSKKEWDVSSSGEQFGFSKIYDLMKIIFVVEDQEDKLSRAKNGLTMASLAACVILRTALSDRIASLNGQTVYYVINQDKRGFYQLMVTSALQAAANAVIASSLKYLTDLIALNWRRRLTKKAMKHYFENNAFYRSVHIANIKDADQRMTRDIERWCDDFANLIPCAIKPVIDASWFSWRCFRLTGWQGIGLLYCYMAFGYSALKSVSPNLSSATLIEHDLESSFRQSHIALRERAESVAFFGGGDRERESIHGRFVNLLEHISSSLSSRFNYDVMDTFLTNQFPHNVTWVISMIFALGYPDDVMSNKELQAKMVKDMRYLATVITQTFTSFGDILSLQKHFNELSGGASRLNRLFHAMESSAEVDEYIHFINEDKDSHHSLSFKSSAMSGLIYSSDNKNLIEFDYADIETPSMITSSIGNSLAKKLTIEIRQGSSLLVSGPNGSGKTSLMRCLAGLWPLQKGTISVPLPEVLNTKSQKLQSSLFFVTQKPYTTLGSLRDQVVYPLSVEDALEKIKAEDTSVDPSEAEKVAQSKLHERMRDLLEQVRLGYLIERWGWDVEVHWVDVLSLGEQQRLGMARAFYHRPLFVALDECTNAVSLDVEEALYSYAKSLGITMITITQRSGLIAFHEKELRLIDGQGSWQLYEINQ